MGRGEWPPLWDELLRRAYGKAGVSNIARAIGVSEYRVRHRAGQLGLTKGRPDEWSAWAVDTLIAMTRRGRSIESCARVLQRSESAVSSKRLKLRRSGLL